MSASEAVADMNEIPQMRWLPDGRTMAERGMLDARAKHLSASEHPYYYESYSRFKRLRQASDGLLVLAMSYATQCHSCGSIGLGHGDACAANCGGGRGPVPLVRGLLCVYGPVSMDDEPVFLSLVELRRLIVGGTSVFNSDGDCANPEILLQ